jgi:sigma-B regulation protein RsbU (phosphoserine phosphatase)
MRPVSGQEPLQIMESTTVITAAANLDRSGAWSCDRATAGTSMRSRLIECECVIDQLAGQLVETQDQLLAMYDLSTTTRSHLGISETLQHLAREATRLVYAQGAVLCVGATIVQYPADLIDERVVLDYLRPDRQRECDLLLSAPHPALPEGITNLCLLPIQIRGDMRGALALVNRAGGFTSPDLKLARAIAEQAGTHIEHALLYQETLDQARLQTEMAVARRVQLQLLPQAWPSVPTLDIYAESRPALEVGGDFYDFVDVPDRSLMLMLGDVAGKGVSAAMIMGMVHVAIRSAARFLPDATPASVLSRTNNDLYDDMTLLDSFTTAFIAQYEPERGLMCYANAGHAPVIYRPPGGRAQLLEADGIPLGVLPVSLSQDYALAFPPGALLVVTTDGFSEARDLGGAMFGYERLLQIVDAFAEQPAQVIARGLYAAVDGFATGQDQEDDQTLIVIKGIA